MDPRLTPANGRVAHESLRGRVDAAVFTAGTRGRVTAPLTDLCVSPDGPRDRQLLMGDAVTTLEVAGTQKFIRSEKDGYCGYVAREDIGPTPAPSHRVSASATHLYIEPDIKAGERARLSLGASLAVTGEIGAFAETAWGFVPRAHLRPVSDPEADPAAVALRLLGTPYLWGGNSRDGIDCSGLVQAALLAAGIACPGDSDLQQAALGTDLAPDSPIRRGDLLFWKGHVSMATDARTMIHANAHHMAVVLEPVTDAIRRIADQGGGPVTRRARL